MTYKCKNLFDDVAFFKLQGWEKQSNGYYLTSQSAMDIFTNIQGESGKISISYSAKVLTTDATIGNTLTFLVSYTDGTSAYIGSLRYDATTYTNITASTDATKTVSTIRWVYANNYTAELKDVMLNFGDALPYEARYEGLRDSKVTALKVIGKNLFDMNNNQLEMGTYEDANFTLNYLVPRYQSLKIYLAAGTYTLSFDVDTKLVRAVIDGTRYPSYANKTFTAKTDGYVGFSFRRTDKADWVDGTLIQIERGETASEYTPYSERNIALPEALQGTGKGLEGYADTVDFENNKKTTNCKTITFNGTENWQAYVSVINHFQLFVGDNRYGLGDFNPIICSHYISDKANGTYYSSLPSAILSADGSRIRIKDERFGDVEAFKAYLAEQYANGTPVTVTYALATPVETDLSESFENILEIEAGGSLEFVNEYSKAIPSSITYLKKEGSI